MTSETKSAKSESEADLFPWCGADESRCNLLNRFFNESEPCFGPASAILPLFNFSLESADPIFGGLMLTSYFLRCKLKYLFGYIDRFLSGDS
jgi:hypothetical protein